MAAAAGGGLVFQIKDVVSRDVYVTLDTSGGEDTGGGGGGGGDKIKQYEIMLFGTTAEGNSVALKVGGFKPFFYVRVPRVCVPYKTELITWCMNAMTSDEAEASEFTMERHKTLFDFNAGTESHFLKITVPSQFLWRSMKDRLLDKSSTPLTYATRELFGTLGVAAVQAALASPPARADLLSEVKHVEGDGKLMALSVYESNIDPALRFFHIQNLSPASWVHVKAGNWSHAVTRDAKVKLSAIAEFTDVVSAADGVGMAPYTVASWDIECNSSHGDFPLASKTWRKPITEAIRGGRASRMEELCDALAEGVRGETAVGSCVSNIYLKAPFPGGVAAAAVRGETVRRILEGRGRWTAAVAALASIHSARGKDAIDKAVSALDKILSGERGDCLPRIAGDEIIQVGTVMYRNGVPVSKHIWVLGACEKEGVKPPGADVPTDVYTYGDELSMIRAWFAWIGRRDPDIMIGYNIFGFDSKYVWDRLMELAPHEKAVKEIVAPLSCLRSRPVKLEEKFLSSSAMGDNTMWFMSSPGRLQIDLLPYIRRNHNLESYSLDNVSATFVSGSMSGLAPVGGAAADTFRFGTRSTKGIVMGRYITLMDEENDRVVDRCLVVGVEPKALTVIIAGGAASLADHGLQPVRWAQVKDDVSPKDIFRLHRGSAADRAVIAKYCLQDCDLVMELFTKLEILNNSVAMANVCSVPVGYIFTRGQGIKIESLIFKECRLVQQLIEVLPSAPRGADGAPADVVSDSDSPSTEVEDTYEGAIVLEPHTGIYVDDPVTADDFASLYPSSIISENISHDTLIWVKDYDNDGNFVCTREGSDRYDNMPGAKYVNIEFDILRPDPGDTRKHPVKLRDGRRVARYIQDPRGTIPRILGMLLDSRKRCRKLAEVEPDEFRRALLDAQQLAYKLTANSLYGQLGSATFKIRRQVLAASTTGYGRKQLMFAKAVIEAVYGDNRDPRCNVECVYGDTDSIFLRFRPRDPVTGAPLSGREALEAAKALTVESGKLVSSCLKSPHDFEFDKIFRSFCLLSKKRYVGDMSEDGVEEGDFHRKSMGIVMKRRDNAPIVKYVYGGVVERILGTTDVASSIRSATEFVQQSARDLLAGKFSMNKLTITKSLRAEYADPTRIAHKVLAERIGARDPGNKPSTSDRIPFVYIRSPDGVAPKLQGDRIETPSFIRENGLTPDYAFYITNQIAKPVAQVFGLEVESMPGVKPADIEATQKARDVVAAREALAEKILFEKILHDAAHRPEVMEARGQKSIASFFRRA
jgi:DNA polymerase elongation subunit (family B)